jgi:hypothetical protein
MSRPMYITLHSDCMSQMRIIYLFITLFAIYLTTMSVSRPKSVESYVAW